MLDFSVIEDGRVRFARKDFFNCLDRAVRKKYACIVTYSPNRGFVINFTEKHGVIYTSSFLDHISKLVNEIEDKFYSKILS